jgi:hypothetical protein
MSGERAISTEIAAEGATPGTAQAHIPGLHSFSGERGVDAAKHRHTTEGAHGS